MFASMPICMIALPSRVPCRRRKITSFHGVVFALYYSPNRADFTLFFFFSLFLFPLPPLLSSFMSYSFVFVLFVSNSLFIFQTILQRSLRVSNPKRLYYILVTQAFFESPVVILPHAFYYQINKLFSFTSRHMNAIHIVQAWTILTFCVASRFHPCSPPS